MPPDEPAGQNPPDGAILDYYLKEDAAEVTLDVLDAKGTIIRHFSSSDTMYAIPQANVPLYWIRPQQILQAKAGIHRFVWNLHWTPLNVPASFPIAATYKNTAPSPTSPWVMPGTYTIRLTAGGQSFTQLLTVVMDPRVKTPIAGLQQQYDLSLLCYTNRKKISIQLAEIAAIQHQIEALKGKTSKALADSLNHLQTGLNDLVAGKSNSLSGLASSFAGFFDILQQADAQPSLQTTTGLKEAQSKFAGIEEYWDRIRHTVIPALNKQLKAEQLSDIVLK
jgi:hypothetical protein